MSGLLPIIELLADATNDADREDWLIRCPLSVLLTYETTIRNRLQHAGFRAGLLYLDAMVSALRSVRDRTGNLRAGPVEGILIAVEQMGAATRGQIASNEPAMPDHSITEI